jgi:hypothetical protein
MKFLFIISLLLMTGCTSSINKLTSPNANVIKDETDGSVLITQPPVTAARDSFESGDAWHTFGFEWFSKVPDIVVFTAGVIGQASPIQDITLIADDEIIQDITPASNTSIDINQTVGIPLKDTHRRFTMPLTQLRKVAAARVVKMKIVRANGASFSQFGKDSPYVAVNGKFAPFLKKVDGLINRTSNDRLAQ